ncbi:MAG: hypothetical protein M5R40_25650 [Anaerolineae bacterium]|nr:hypothetical protein [Anaerolineae bacterium]
MALHPQADSQFSITLRGDDAIAGRLYATVYDPDGYVIESAPAEDSSLNDIYAYVTGEYRAVVMALGSTGAYSLTYDRAILPPTPEPTLAGALSLGSEVAGSLEYGARHAWTLAVAEDVVVDITLLSSPPGALDTYLYLRDADGAALLSNDDTLTSTDSALVGVPLAGGSTYAVVAGSYADSGEGDYVLRVQPSPVMDLGETVRGELHPDGAPVGWVLRVEAAAVVDIDARWAEAGQQSDLWVQVYDTQNQYYPIDTTSTVRNLQLGGGRRLLRERVFTQCRGRRVHAGGRGGGRAGTARAAGADRRRRPAYRTGPDRPRRVRGGLPGRYLDVQPRRAGHGADSGRGRRRRGRVDRPVGPARHVPCGGPRAGEPDPPARRLPHRGAQCGGRRCVHADAGAGRAAYTAVDRGRGPGRRADQLRGDGPGQHRRARPTRPVAVQRRRGRRGVGRADERGLRHLP